MPEIHFFGFGLKTRGMMWEIGKWIRDNIQDHVLSGHAESILNGAVLVGHPQTIVEGLKDLNEQPYILVQSSDQEESEKLVELLSRARLPIRFDIVEGATLRCFVQGAEPVSVVVSGQIHAGQCNKGV